MTRGLLHVVNGCRGHLEDARAAQPYGRVVRVAGPLVESVGPRASVGELCRIERPDGFELAEVVGFQGPRLLLMTYGQTHGFQAGALVRTTGSQVHVPVGAGMLGRVVDALGRPMDGRGPLTDVRSVPIDARVPHPLERSPISEPLGTGVRALDGFLALGRGQRMGIFAGSGVGKSVLLGDIARHTEADIAVVALVGERGREVGEFLDHDLGARGLERSVVVVATAEQPPLIRVKAAFTATRIAEAFRDQGRQVLLLMDSLTRVAMAQREIGLSRGEPPTTRGYTPSVFSLLPQLLERAGQGPRGSVTGLYTVLVEGDDLNDPIADSARSVLDGHVVLSRKLANRGHFPAVDVLASISRLAVRVSTPAQNEAQRRVRGWMAAYSESEDLIQLGAYVRGADPMVDEAIDRMPEIQNFLRQPAGEGTSRDETVRQLLALAGQPDAEGAADEAIPVPPGGARAGAKPGGEGGGDPAGGAAPRGADDRGGDGAGRLDSGAFERGASGRGLPGAVPLGGTARLAPAGTGSPRGAGSGGGGEHERAAAEAGGGRTASTGRRADPGSAAGGVPARDAA